MTAKTKVFICYAREDESSARRLFHDLRRIGLDPWLDKESLLPGQKWQPAIQQAIKESRYFLALLSSTSVSKRGFVQKEIRVALETLDEFSESNIFVIPIRLDNCKPEYQRLSELHWVDMFPDWEVGLGRILSTIDADRCLLERCVPYDELYQIAADLTHLIRNGDYVVWVGAGLSKGAGYPGWEETIDILCSECGMQFLGPEEKSIEGLIEKAEECKNENIEVYHKTLANLFGKNVVNTRLAFQFLMKLPFKGYITTNFDPLLCEAAALCGYNNIYSYPYLNIEKLYTDEHPIFHIHGLARHGDEPKGEDLVLARSDFDEAYQGSVPAFLDPVLAYHPILFVGCSLSEPSIKATFQRVHKIHSKIKEKYFGIDLPKRYILLPRHQIVKEEKFHEMVIDPISSVSHDEYNEEERFQAMNIDIIRYTRHDESYWEIEQILRYMLNIKGDYESPKPWPSNFQEERLC